jgi:hypothetical protein
MPTVLVLFGMRFDYWAREHEPVHVKKGNAEACFNMEPEVALTDHFGFRPHELALAEEIIRDNRKYMKKEKSYLIKKTA